MNLTEGMIDLHYHSGPDVKPRKLNDLELMEQAVALGARAVVIKTHNTPTAGRAALVNQVCREKYPQAEFTMFGGIALNRSVGGLNPWALETELKLGAKLVWLPTVDSENEHRKAGRSCVVPHDGENLVLLNGDDSDENGMVEKLYLHFEECGATTEVVFERDNSDNPSYITGKVVE